MKKTEWWSKSYLSKPREVDINQEPYPLMWTNVAIPEDNIPEHRVKVPLEYIMKWGYYEIFADNSDFTKMYVIRKCVARRWEKICKYKNCQIGFCDLDSALDFIAEDNGKAEL